MWYFLRAALDCASEVKGALETISVESFEAHVRPLCPLLGTSGLLPGSIPLMMPRSKMSPNLIRMMQR